MTFWDAVAPLYDIFEKTNKAYKHMIDKINELTPQGAGVLELASGTGAISARVSGKASRVLCSDLSENMLRAARRKLKRRGTGNISFEKISIFEMGKQDNEFDVVIASQILHLLDNPQKACVEIRRVTKDMAIISIPLIKEVTPWGGFLISLYRLFGFRPRFNFDRADCKAFLEEMGFNKCEYYTISGTVSLCLAIWRKNL